MVERDDAQGESRLAWPKLVKKVSIYLLSLFGALVLIDFTGLSDIRIFPPIEPPWITKQSAQESTPSETANPAAPTQAIEALRAGVPKASDESTVTVTWNGVGDSVVVNWDPYDYPELYEYAVYIHALSPEVGTYDSGTMPGEELSTTRRVNVFTDPLGGGEGRPEYPDSQLWQVCVLAQEGPYIDGTDVRDYVITDSEQCSAPFLIPSH